MNAQKDHFRISVCLVLAALLLLLSPVRVLSSWGLEVGRADTSDVASLMADWIAFKKARTHINNALLELVPRERQKQLLGDAADDKSDLRQLAESTQHYWFEQVLTPLQRVALNPAASCAEAQFAVTTMLGAERQRQLIGLEDSPVLAKVVEATKQMVSLRCREEALDECVATGRFKQIIEHMANEERTLQMFGHSGSPEEWAVDALKQCAIYELHFVSTTKTVDGQGIFETVSDGRIPIKFEMPANGISAGLPMSELLKGRTKGGNNPFLVSIKCVSPTRELEIVCSPGADSTPVQAAIAGLELKHREFYVDRINVFDRNVGFVESEITKERVGGENKLSFDLEGGVFSIQALFKSQYATAPVPLNLGTFGTTIASGDMISGDVIKFNGTQRGVYPVIFEFTYSGKLTGGMVGESNSTKFELIHKPQPKPFPQPSPQPNRKPLRPRPGA